MLHVSTLSGTHLKQNVLLAVCSSNYILRASSTFYQLKEGGKLYNFQTSRLAALLLSQFLETLQRLSEL